MFENKYLHKAIKKELTDREFKVYSPMRVPVNDGGISFGQAAAAAHMLKTDS